MTNLTDVDDTIVTKGAAGAVLDEVESRPDGVHGIVLAGVHSWGDCLLDEVICRPAIPVAARPLICHCLQWLRREGIRTASLCANSDTGYLRRSLGTGRELGLTLDYYEDMMPRGPAGSLRDAAVVSDARLFVVVYGTVVPHFRLADLLQAHESAGACVTVLATRIGRTRATQGLLQPAGVYVFTREALDYIPPRGYQDIKETLLPRLHAEGQRVITHVGEEDAVGRIVDTGSYVAVCRWTLERLAGNGKLEQGYDRVGEARVHETAAVSATARLIGPVVVERDCVIDDEAVIVAPTIVGERSLIGRRAAVARSIVWSDCRIGLEAVVDDCVLTQHTVIEDGLVVRGTICAAK